MIKKRVWGVVLGGWVMMVLDGCVSPQERRLRQSRERAFISYWPAHAQGRNMQIVGKTNLTEFAVTVSGENRFFGTPKSRLDGKNDGIPGGYLSGSAVAVATHMADVAFGTDTGGSIRVPAACNGVYGMKTTFGLVSTKGVFPISPKHLDTVGPLARTTVFAAALLVTCTISRAQSAAELMLSGDVYDVQFKANDALRYYLPAEKLEPGNVALLVRIARQCRLLMSDAGTGAEKLRIGAVALDYGKRAAKLGPNDSDAQISPAITYGRMLPYQGNKEQVAATPLIKAGADVCAHGEE